MNKINKSDMNDLAPIVLFVYNRLWHTKKTIESLQNNALAKDSVLYIYSDYFKDEKSKRKVDEVREYVNTITGFKEVNLVFREYNYGLANSVIDGVNEVIDKHGKVIVLEDDLVSGQYFLKFMNDCLTRYQEEKRIWHVSGYMYPVDDINSCEVLFTNYTSSWGWGTWKDRWKFFERDPDSLIKEFSKQQIKKFNFNGFEDIWYQVIANKKGKLYTWAVFWYATVFKKDGLCVYPYKSLIKNIGHDGSGDNCRNSNRFDTVILNEPIEKFEDNIELNLNVLNKTEEYFRRNRKNVLIRSIVKLMKFFNWL
jgi:hypothetical protein